MTRVRRHLLALGLALGASLAACNGCKHGDGRDAHPTVVDVGAPSVRLYLLADVAGALEPCGCQKDMLGGLDHFGAYVAAEKSKAPNALVLAAGPLFYMDTATKPERVEQDDWKAEAIAKGFAGTGGFAFTPGKNDWRAGSAKLDALRTASGGALVAANLSGEVGGAVHVAMRDVGGIKVAIVGVTVPRDAKGAPAGLTIDDAAKALAAEAKKARADGARIVVGMAAFDRGEALRAAEAATELDVLVVGSPSADGDVNDQPKSPRLVGSTLVVQPSNHLTRAAVVDLFVRGDGRFADGSNLAKAEDLTRLQTDTEDLERRIANWETNKNISAADLEAQKKRLAELRDKLEKAKAPPPPPAGSFLRYALVDIKQSLGSEPNVSSAMKAFYVRVNQENAKKFAGKRAPAPEKDGAQYVGVEVCKTCHAAPYEVWKSTQHSHAYATLVDQSKEFNLDCVSCHVTGFEKPGGSSVTDVAELKDVQCETCHGPGSKHVQKPVAETIHRLPDESLCVSCHHPPHVSEFVYGQRLTKVLGPGHGMPGKPSHQAPPKDWTAPKPRFAEPG